MVCNIYNYESLKKLMTVVAHTMFLSHIKTLKLCVCFKGRVTEFCYCLIPSEGDEVYKMKARYLYRWMESVYICPHECCTGKIVHWCLRSVRQLYIYVCKAIVVVVQERDAIVRC